MLQSGNIALGPSPRVQGVEVQRDLATSRCLVALEGCDEDCVCEVEALGQRDGGTSDTVVCGLEV